MARNFSIDNTNDVLVSSNMGTKVTNETGAHFFLSETMNLASGVTCNYFVMTPNITKLAHMNISVRATGDTMLTLDNIGLAGSSTGTNIATSYRNWIATHKPNPGTLICRNAIGSTGGATSVFQAYLPEDGVVETGELVLSQSSHWLLLLRNASATNTVTTMFDWYEYVSQV